MLEILPIQLKSEQEALAARCEITYNPDLMAYSAILNGDTVGICQFSMKSGVGHIDDIALLPGMDDNEIMLVLGRAALNFIDLCGVHEAYYDGHINNNTLIRQIGFSQNSDGNFYINLTDFFNHPCKHC